MDSIKRFDGEKMMKMINIADLQKTHPTVYQQLRAVPALMVLPSREIIYGKAVFDYLLLPSRGKLVVGPQAPTIEQPIPSGNSASHGVLHSEEGIMAFNSAKSFSGDSFAYISENNATPEFIDNNPHSSYNWASIDGVLQSSESANTSIQQSNPSGKQPAFGLSTIGMETRQQKESLDIDKLRAQREQDMQSIFTSQTIPI